VAASRRPRAILAKAAPSQNPFVAPLLYSVPVQLLACAVLKGTDVDQPRNLAKSVTVE
jgi:glucosamine--fructose-6-phosphate aminotransferase (isomerizing)